MDVNCPVVQSSMMIKTKITVGQSVYSAIVSVSQDTGFEVVVSLISSLCLVNVEKCDKVSAAHASHQSHVGTELASPPHPAYPI